MNLERVEAVNPIYGMRIIDKYDPYPCGYSEDALIGILNSVSDTRHDYDMLMECASFEEVDAYYNPGIENITDDFILEAIVVDKFSKTERRMAAVVRVMNKHLGDSEINALAPIVGKPKKTGSYAYVTVQLPFSDGQVVSIIFHAPEGDKKKIGPSDQIIAFRWLLNKRDITQVVAPEDGSEISLESIAKRVTQLVVKNSARFERTQKEAQAERQELEKAREDLKEAQARQEELIQNMETSSKDNETLAAQLSNTLALLEKQKTINAELQAKLDALRKSTGKGTGGGTNKKRPPITDNEFEDMVKTAARWKGAAIKVEQELDKIPGYENAWSKLNRMTTKGDLDAYLMRKYGIDASDARSVSNELTAKNIQPDMNASIAEFQDEPWAKLLFEAQSKNGGTGTNGTSTKGTDGEEPQFVKNLNDILSGKYDTDTDKIDSLLDKAAEDAEKGGTFAKYEDLFNQAADYLTALFKKKQQEAA